jgi:hypothetical protein
MPVRKFRSVEEMNQPVWRRPGEPGLYEAIAALWELGRRTSKKRWTPGVRRFRSIEAMDAAQQRE